MPEPIRQYKSRINPELMESLVKARRHDPAISHERLARRFGVSRTTVRNYLVAAGIAEPPQPSTPKGPNAKARKEDPTAEKCTDQNMLLNEIRRVLCGYRREGARWVEYGRLEVTEAGYRLDGKPVGFGDVVRETNRIRKEAGMGQIGKNPAWMV